MKVHCINMKSIFPIKNVLICMSQNSPELDTYNLQILFTEPSKSLFMKISEKIHVSNCLISYVGFNFIGSIDSHFIPEN